MSAQISPALPYFIGCPVWAYRNWKGVIFDSATTTERYLTDYSAAFNSVEGNNTFYGLPKEETVEKWADQALPGFHFCFKFPRTITHDKMLSGVEMELRHFLDLLAILQRRNLLGPLMLQLSPDFDIGRLYLLELLLAEIPKNFRIAVEVRHSDFYDQGEKEAAFVALLKRYQADRVIFDTRPLFSAPPSDKDEEEAQRRKPKSPVRLTACGRHPLIRLVSRNDPDQCLPWVKEWAPVVASWIKDGKVPYIFLHAPDDVHAPRLCHLFHRELQTHIENLPSLPPLGREQRSGPEQLDLFS